MIILPCVSALDGFILKTKLPGNVALPFADLGILIDTVIWKYNLEGNGFTF